MEIEDMRKAIELHRPIGYDKYGHVTNDPSQVSEKFGHRCAECGESVGSNGCLTWRVGNGTA